MNTEEMVDILRAEESGQELERRIFGAPFTVWALHPTLGGLNFADYVYRIKEQPETVEVFVWKSREGVVIVKQCLSDEERMDLFSGGWVFKKSVNIEV